MLTVLWEDVPADPGQSALLERLYSAACAATNTDPLAEVTVLLTGNERLRELNRAYRNKNATTDVLSFSQRESSEDAGCKPALPGEESSERYANRQERRKYLGDIAISLERVAAQALSYGHSEDRELGYLFVHGFLHLLGHTHADETAFKQMRAREEEILSSAGLPRNASSS